MSVRVLHADDSDAFRRLVQLALPNDEVEVVASVAAVREVMPCALESRPDVLLVDQFGDTAFLDRVREELPDTAIVVLSGYPAGCGDPEAEARSDGYVAKMDPVEAWREAVVAAAHRRRAGA